MAREERDVVSVGVSHKQREDGTVELDQDAYIAQLVPISGPSLFGKPADEEADAALQWAFMSLLGAVAYALITHHWVSVYVVALQRRAQKALCLHVRRLNAVVRAVQRNPARVVLQAMKCSSGLEGHSDSAFAKEQDKGYGLRG